MHRGEVLRSVVTAVSGRRCGVDRVVTLRARSASTAAPGTSTTTSGSSATTRECVVIDAAARRPADPASRRPTAQGHGDPAAPTRTTTTSPPSASLPTRPARRSYLHPADRMLWDARPPGHPGRRARRRRRHPRSATSTCTCCTPPATPPVPAASTRPALGVVFTGDTLFKGGPGATGRSFSDFPTIVSRSGTSC